MYSTKPAQNIEFDFLVSALSRGTQVSTADALQWMTQRNEAVQCHIEKVPLDSLQSWEYVDGHICHVSGKFFSIDGIRIDTNYGHVDTWDQPIINQPEIGFLGFITKKIDGVLHFLLQAKIEPGNLNIVQLSPTLQATRSNYTRVHKGAAPKYLEYFTGEQQVDILLDQLQSEQGARFMRKRNRNIIIEVASDHDLPIYDDFIWLSLGQIKELLGFANICNMDTRTVISCINYGSYSEENLSLLAAFNLLKDHGNRAQSYLYSLLSQNNHLNELHSIVQWITSLKFKYELDVTRIPIDDMKGWTYDGSTITHHNDKYFRVIGVDVQIGNREVIGWHQPMVESAQEGLMGFIVKKINGIYHFLVQAKLESGNFDVLELAPTVQCLTGNYHTGHNEYVVPYIHDVLHAPEEKVWYSTYQSEEGGRFYQEQNLNKIVEVGDEFPIDVAENYCWMTLNQLVQFGRYNNYLNIAARSLLSGIRLY